mgnify:CR=1 FL=1
MDQGKDDLVDLSKIFAGQKNMIAGHSTEYLESFQHTVLFWDSENASQYLSLDNEYFDARVATSTTSEHSFKTVFAAEPFEQGDRYYFEIKFMKGCNFKIGVGSNRRQTDVAFCYSPDGFGYYSAGQLRNGSKTTGAKYGECFRGTKDQDVVGVYVDLIDGKIFFSKNGIIYRAAFQGPHILANDMYAACCCLTKDESFELLLPQPED